MWEYVSAEKVGDSQVRVVIQRPPQDEGAEPEQQVLEWTKDPEDSWQTFYAMVRREVKVYLDYLNALESESTQDLTDYLRPR